VEFTDEIIGARLLETITDGLYNRNLNCIREYVQNSIDEGASNINIFFENGNKTLVIADNGPGMDKEGLKEALSIGKSKKTPEQIGWRGIGIWSGVSASMKLVIITKMKNKPKLKIEIDNEKLRSDSRSNDLILKLLSSATSEIQELDLDADETRSSHFTKIRLESILPTQQQKFSDDKIEEFLSKIVPAPFNLLKFPELSKVNDYLASNNVHFPDVTIKLNGKKIFRPPYDSSKYYDVITYQKFTINKNTIAVGWFLTGRENKELNWPNGGIIFKKKGMSIGDENLIREFYKKKYFQWQYGEIHVISETIREDAGRNGFEYFSEDYQPFIDDVVRFVNSLQNVNRYKSYNVKTNKINKIRKELNDQNLQLARKDLQSIQKSTPKNFSYPELASLQSIKEAIDNHTAEIKTDIEQLNEQIGTSQDEIEAEKIRLKKEELKKAISNLPKPVRKNMSKFKGAGIIDPVVTVADAIEEILKQKTGLKPTKFFELISKAYGFDEVPRRKDGANPILRIDQNDLRNRRFGVMVYTFYDLIVNKYKHERGHDALKWLEDLSEEDRLEVTKEIIISMGLLYRLIEFSKKE
jgi:hypothetical protein